MRALKAETDVAAALAALFRRWPALVGFCVQETPAAELVVSDLETDPGREQSRELWSEIAAALLELVDEHPAARDLLRGRTFARTLH